MLTSARMASVVRNGALGLGLVALAVAPKSASSTNLHALAPTPPMGWATWYGLRCDYDAATLDEIVTRLEALRLKQAGYSYVNVDDCWAVGRDSNGELIEDSQRFPGGMEAVAARVHASGLKFGIYTSAGTTTCQKDLQADGTRLPVGSKGHEYRDARRFAAMGADFVKVDWCGRYPTQDSRASFETWRDAIAATGRPMLLSICEWGLGEPWQWGRGTGHMWRIAMDTLNCWACTTEWGGIGVVQTFDRLAEHAAASGPNGWNDPDVLMVGNGVLTLDEERAQMSVYAVAPAPLIVAADLRTIRSESVAILTDPAVVAVNQDALGKAGRRMRTDDGEDIWVRPLSGGRHAIVLVNRNARPRTIRLYATELDIGRGARFGVGRELWSRKAVTAADKLEWRVPAHGAALFVFEAPVGDRVRAPI